MLYITKNCSFKLETKSDDQYYHIKGYSSTYGNADRDGDVINKGAFDESLCSEKPIALWQHDQSQPIGIANVVSDNKGLNTELLLPKNDQFVNSRVIPQLEIGAVKSFSIGMSIPKSGISYKNRLRYIEKAFLREVSLVSIPANPKAIIESIKSVDPYKSLPLADDDTSWDSSQAVKSIRHYTNSKESPSADYKRAFMWLDPENDDNFTSYKMPFATVVDGELKAVPRALSAIVGVLNGARGGVSDISESDISKIKSVVSSYYEKMGKDDPFKLDKQFTIEEVKKVKSKRDLEYILRESGMFSKSASLYLASLTNLSQSESEDNYQVKLFNELNKLSKQLRA